PLPSTFAALIAGGSLFPAVRFTRRLFGVQPRTSTRAADDAVYGQRIDAYRAALEASFARDSMEEDADFLGALRERFGISEAEDRVLRHYAKSSVIVARDRKASEAFERLRLLGEGGGGRTWLARDRQRDRLVVLKEPLQQWQQDPQTREAVLREARLAAKVRHPNVVSVEEVVEGKGSPIIVMEYLEGGSLSDLLRSRGTLPWREAVPLVIDVARGLEAVHSAGIVHRDVKPSNILLNGEGAPKVADFGIALPVVSTRTVLDVGSTARAGTLFYMAPEVRAGMSVRGRAPRVPLRRAARRERARHPAQRRAPRALRAPGPRAGGAPRGARPHGARLGGGPLPRPAGIARRRDVVSSKAIRSRPLDRRGLTATHNQDRLGRLRAFGLSDYAARAYLALLDLGIAEARDVSTLSKVPQAKIYAVLEQLQEKGLVLVLPEFPKKYAPVPFEEHLQRLFEEHTRAAATIEREREELAALFRVVGDAEVGDRGFFTVLRGRRNVLGRLEEIAEATRRTLLVLATPGSLARADSLVPTLAAARARGVDVRVVAPIEAATLPALARLAPHARV